MYLHYKSVRTIFDVIRYSVFIIALLFLLKPYSLYASTSKFDPITYCDSDSVKHTEISILIVYYSFTGNTEKMARAVAEGAQKIPGVNVITRTIDKVTETELKHADAILLGSPTYYGNMAGQMKSFIDDWWLKYKISLVNKVGGAFSTGGSQSGGKEHVIHSLVIAMMSAGMILVGPLEGPFGLAGASALDPVDEKALKEARSLGEHAASVAQRFRNTAR